MYDGYKAYTVTHAPPFFALLWILEGGRKLHWINFNLNTIKLCVFVRVRREIYLGRHFYLGVCVFLVLVAFGHCSCRSVANQPTLKVTF